MNESFKHFQIQKKFILAICKPEHVDVIQISNDLYRKLETNKYKNELMKNYAIYLAVSKSDEDQLINLIIQGDMEDVVKAKSILELDLSAKTSEEANTIDAPEIINDEDDIIWIDPYELFDSTNKPKVNKVNQLDPFTLSRNDRESKDIENKMKNLQFSKGSNKEVASNNFSENKHAIPIHLLKTSLLMGFNEDEIHRGYTGFNSPNLDEIKFLEYLRATKNPNQSKINSIDEIKKTNSIKSSLSPSVQSQGPAAKKQNISDSEIIEIQCNSSKYLI